MRRYGFLRPTIMNQLIAFTSLCLYQLLVLFPLSVLTAVNLNFALCHSPADFTYQLFGSHYFAISMFSLNLYAYFGRWFVYLILVKPYEIIVSLIKGDQENSNKDKE